LNPQTVALPDPLPLEHQSSVELFTDAHPYTLAHP
jgi:hypothetical protein